MPELNYSYGKYACDDCLSFDRKEKFNNSAQLRRELDKLNAGCTYFSVEDVYIGWRLNENGNFEFITGKITDYQDAMIATIKALGAK